MTDNTFTPARAQECDRLLSILIGTADAAERLAAGRALGVVSPEGVTPVQSTVITRCVRTADGNLWAQLEGAQGPIAQYVLPALTMQSVLAAVAAITSYPHLTAEEHAAHTSAVQTAKEDA